MNGGKRLISALLALAMVGQLGMVVIGSAAEEFKCVAASGGTSIDHGMSGRVTNINGCSGKMHWLAPDAGNTIKTGGTGTNYLYPDSNTDHIYCNYTVGNDSVKNYIIFGSAGSLPGSLTIENFSSGDVILLADLPEEKVISTDNGELEPSSELEGAKEFEIDNCIITLVSSGGSAPSVPESVTIKPLPAGKLSVDLENSGGQVTVNIKDNGQSVTAATGYTYLRGMKVEGQTNYTTIETIAKSSPVPASSGKYYYMVVENATGRTAVSDTPLSCPVTPEHISYEDKAVSENQPFTLGADDGTKTYPFSVAYSAGTGCNVTDHNGDANHGYTVKWSVDPSGNGVSVGAADGILTLGEGLSTTPKTVTLQAEVSRGGTAIETLKANIQVKKEEAVIADPSDPTNSSASCDKALKSVTINGLPSGSVSIEKGKTQTYDLTCNVEWSGACNDTAHDDSYHDTTVTWDVQGAAFDHGTGRLTINGSELSTTPKTITVSVSVSSGDGSEPVKKSGTISASRPAVCEKIPASVQISGYPAQVLLSTSTTAYAIPLSAAVDWDNGLCELHTGNSHGETVVWSVTGTPDPSGWAKIDAAGRLTLDGSKLSADAGQQIITVQATATANGKDSTGTVTIAVSPDDTSISFRGSDPATDPVSEISITSASAATVSSTYTASLDSPENYNYTWTLTVKNNPGASRPAYIKCSPSATDPTTATVTITKSGLPATAVNQVFELTVIATPKSLSQQNLLTRVVSAIMPLADDAPVKIASYDITVKAAANSNGTGSSGSTGSGGSSGSSSSGSSRYETDRSNYYQWMDVVDDIEDARKGSTVKVSLGSNTDMPYYVFEALRGEDVSLQMKVSGGYTWTVSGRSVKSIPNSLFWVSLGVESYSNSKMTALCRDSKIKGFRLENIGSFFSDMRLTINLGSSYAKKTVYLYSYNELNNRLTYASSAKAADNGDVEFTFTDSLETYVITSKALYGESAVSTGGGVVGSGTPSVLYPPEVSLPSSTQTPALAEPAPSVDAADEAAPAPAETIPAPGDNAPAIVQPEPEPETPSFPILVPLLILAIAGVITATVLVVRNGRDQDFGIGYTDRALSGS